MCPMGFKLSRAAGNPKSMSRSVVQESLRFHSTGKYGHRGKIFAVGYRADETPLPMPSSTSVPPHCDVLHRSGRSRNYRRLNFGAVPGYAPVSADRNDPESLRRALAKRVGRDVPPCTRGELVRLGAFVADWLDKHVRPVSVPTFEEWLAGTSYNEARKQELRNVFEQERGQLDRKKASHIDSFSKLESYPEYKEQRWINSRHDAFKVFSGPAFKAIEDELYKNPWFIKHVPVPDRPALIAALRKAGLFYYENDYKAFESHFLAEIMEVLELQLYRHCLKMYPKLANEICGVIAGNNRLHTKAGVRLNILARRMSGDMCTSLGNGFSNLMIVLYIVSKKGGEVSGFVEGDDGIFATTVPLTASDFEQLGFTVEIKKVDDPTDAHFCGMTVSESGEVLKDPRRVFQTFGWTHSCINAGNAIMDQLLKSKALSLAYELPNCPIVGQLARTALELTQGLSRRDESDSRHSAPQWFLGPSAPFAPSQSAREKVARLFGIPIPAQLAAERMIREHDMDALAGLLPPVCDAAHLHDVLDYSIRYVEYG